VLALWLAPFLPYALNSVILIILNTAFQRHGGPGKGDILITCAAIVQSYVLLIAGDDPERGLHQSVHGGPVDSGGYVHQPVAGGIGLVVLPVCKTLFLAGVLLFPVLFTASAVFAAEPFCDITASIVSTILFLRFTPRLLDAQCSSSIQRIEMSTVTEN